jgi:hypothetical protein
MDVTFYLNKGENSEFREEEFPNVIIDYKRMIDVFIYLINTMTEKKIKDDYWRFFSELLAIKFTLSANTLTNIIISTLVKSELADYSAEIIDISSIYTLMRSQIENYSTFHYLYINSKSKQVQEFRCLIYELAGLQSRQQFDATLPELRKVKLEEEKRINDILLQLKGNNIFLSLDKSEQKKIINDKKAMLYGWKKVIGESDLIDNLYKKSWMLYSNFAHSEYMSLIQLRYFIKSPQKTISIRNLVQNLAMVLICIFIKDFISLYPEIEERFNSLCDDDRKVIEFFNGLGRESIFLNKKL